MKAKKKTNVFLVDDDPLFLEALRHFLSEGNKTSLNIKTFSTGEACLEQMDENPDIVILDYYLNSSVKKAMNGIAVLKRIKHSHPLVKVVLLSAQDNVEIAMETIEHGAFDYVYKSESAFVRIKNIIMNISHGNSLAKELDNKIALYKKINITFIIIVALLFILSRIIK